MWDSCIADAKGKRKLLLNAVFLAIMNVTLLVIQTGIAENLFHVS